MEKFCKINVLTWVNNKVITVTGTKDCITASKKWEAKQATGKETDRLLFHNPPLEAIIPEMTEWDSHPDSTSVGMLSVPQMWWKMVPSLPNRDVYTHTEMWAHRHTHTHSHKTQHMTHTRTWDITHDTHTKTWWLASSRHASTAPGTPQGKGRARWKERTRGVEHTPATAGGRGRGRGWGVAGALGQSVEITGGGGGSQAAQSTRRTEIRGGSHSEHRPAAAEAKRQRQTPEQDVNGSRMQSTDTQTGQTRETRTQHLALRMQIVYGASRRTGQLQ